MSNFTQDEINYLSNLANILVGKVMKDYLTAVVNEGVEDAAKKNTLLTTINNTFQHVPEYTGNMTIDIPFSNQRVALELAVVSANYTIEVALPGALTPTFFRGFFTQIDALINMSMTYYKQLGERTELLHQMQDAFPDVDCSKFIINPNTRCICFNEESAHRIGIKCSLVSAE